MVDYIDWQGKGSNRKTDARFALEEQRRAELAGITRSVRPLAVFGTRDMFQQFVTSAGTMLSSSLLLGVQTFNAQVLRNNATTLNKIHQAVAEDALLSIIEAYPQGKTAPYRNDVPDKHGRMQRDAGGKLRNALSSHNMYRVSHDGIDFINPIWLDSQARQWYRLNFGAGQMGATTPKIPAQKVVIFGQSIPGDFGLSSYKPSPSFSLPPGYWFQPGNPGYALMWNRGRKGKGDYFNIRANGTSHIISNRRRYISKTPRGSIGFAGSRFLDVGVNRMLETLPREYTKLLKKWVEKFMDTGAGPVASKSVITPRADVKRAWTTLNHEVKNMRKDDLRRSPF